MVDVRGDVLRPPHGTTPAAVKSNKSQKRVPLRAMKKVACIVHDNYSCSECTIYLKQELY